MGEYVPTYDAFPQAHRIRRQVSVGPKRDKYFAVPIVNQVIGSYSRVCSASLPSDSDTRDRGLVTDARQNTFDYFLHYGVTPAPLDHAERLKETSLR